MKITKEKLIDYIYENIRSEISRTLYESKRDTIFEQRLRNIVENIVLEYLFHDNGSVFGSDRFDYDKEYSAVDHDTIINVLNDGGWYYTDARYVKSPSGQKAIRFVLDFGCNRKMSISNIYNELKERAMYPEGVKITKTNNGRYVLLVYRYRNDV